MKKLFMILIIMIFSTSVYSGPIDDMFDFGSEKTGDIVSKVTPERCPITNDTPLNKIDRPIYEMGAVLNVFDFPNGGDAQMRVENWNLSLIINLGPTFHAYSWMGSRSTTKNKYTYQNEKYAYDEDWSSTMIFAGFGLYLVPQFRIFAGVGNVTMENTKGDVPSLSTGMEIGVGWSENFYGNRIEIVYKTVIAPVSGNNIPAEQAIATGSHNSMSIGLHFPLGN